MTKNPAATLPGIRLEMTGRHFENCATNYRCPYFTKQGRRKVRAKQYLCLFLCSVYECIGTNDSQMGWPKKMLSDNGTNFVAAEKEICELVAQLDQNQIDRAIANKGIMWYGNPPLAPHFGGVFQSMIKSAEPAIAAVLPNADVDDEVLQTIFTGVKSLLNSRPQTTISDDPNDKLVLTPNHFIIGQMGEILFLRMWTQPYLMQRSVGDRLRVSAKQMEKMNERIYSTHRISKKSGFHQEEFKSTRGCCRNRFRYGKMSLDSWEN